MGALHAGHLSLINGRDNATVIVSIFVNPLQFGQRSYQLTHVRRGSTTCEQAGVDAIFAPTAEEMGAGELGECAPHLSSLRFVPHLI